MASSQRLYDGPQLLQLVPLHLRSIDGDVRLVATISTFVTALDVTVSELRLEAFLPADQETAAILSRRHAARAQRGDTDIVGSPDWN